MREHSVGLVNPKLIDGHLRRVTAWWGLLADFGFSDLLLLTPVDGTSRWNVVGQVRPTTGQTLYPDDLVGSQIQHSDRPLLTDTWKSGLLTDANVQALGTGQAVRAQAILVRLPSTATTPESSRRIAVLLKEEALETGRRRGQLERTYLGIYERLAAMVEAGRFPFDEIYDPRDSPRVGDGVALLDEQQRFRYVSPNATSALHRLGVRTNIEGRSLAEIGLQAASGSVQEAWVDCVPVSTEIEHHVSGVSDADGRDRLGTSQIISDSVSNDDRVRSIVSVYCIPLLVDSSNLLGSADGAVLLLRDITELRRRDRLLLSKDATIREVHHRVKNNLQTISALLRLQGRRLKSEEAKQAIEESVRRIRSIALVHETLSQEFRESVHFDDLIRPLMRIVEEGLQGDDQPVRFSVAGDAGSLPAEVATPLAVVLVELLQNAVEHAYPNEPGGEVQISFAAKPGMLHVTVSDNGVGFPNGFSLSTTRSLGLTIVRTLIATELGGVIATRNDNGAVIELRIPTELDPPIDR